jgi:hypothetical protein
MTIAVISLLLNLLIAGLLMATISYCWVLNKRIKILQDGKSELANLLQYFDESTARASESIVALQSASKKIGENIQTRIDKVNYLMDDLAFMVEKGNRLANQLDANFAVNLARRRVISENNIEDETEEFAKPEKHSEKNITKQSQIKEVSEPPKQSEKLSTKEKTAASLEAVLDRVIGRVKPANGNIKNENIVANEKSVPNRSKGTTNARSKAEQELLDMIRAGIKG